MRLLIILPALCALLAAVSRPGGAVSAQFAADCQALTGSAHRLTGTAGDRAAADYVTARLRAIGVDQVISQPFACPQLVVKRCEVAVTAAGGDARTLTLYPMRPNGIIPPITPAEGITGELLYAKTGELADYGTQSPRGKVVVLDYNAGANWLRAFRLGAQAVIFAASGEAQSTNPHYTEANTNLPRYYYPGSPADLAAGTATIHCDVTWERVTGRNVIAYLKGANPVLDSKIGKEALVLAANLDSYGEVPTLTPGARSAANCAGLLKMTAYLAQHRPRRDVVIAFFDGQAYGHLGASAFYTALEGDAIQFVKLQTREKFLNEEKAFLQKMVDSLRAPETLSVRAASYDEISRRLRNKAAEHVFEMNGVMEDLRKAQMKLKAQDSAQGAPLADSAEIAKFQAQVDELQAAKTPWNGLRRALGKNNLDAARSDKLVTLYMQVAGEVRGDIEARLAELQDDAAVLKAGKAVYGMLGGKQISLHTSLLFGDGTPRWGLLIGGDSPFHSAKDNPGLYGKIQGTFLDAAKALPTTATAHFETATADGTFTTKLFFPGSLVHSGDIPGHLGIYNLALGTVQEWLPREGTPDDQLARLDLDRLETQVDEAAALYARVASAPGLSIRSAIELDRNYVYPEWRASGQMFGPSVMGITRGSSVPNTPMPNTVVQLFVNASGNKIPGTFGYQLKKIPGFCGYQVLMTNANAIYAYGPVSQDTKTVAGFATRFTPRGEVEAVCDKESVKSVATRLNVFPCASRTLRGGELVFNNRAGAAVLAPQTDAGDTTVMQGLSNSPLIEKKAFFATQDGVVFWYADSRVEDIKLFGLQSLVSLVNGDEHAGFSEAQKRAEREKQEAAQNAYLGKGTSLLDGWLFPSTAVRSAADLWRLNEKRLDILRQRGVKNSSIEELQGRDEDLLIAANEAQGVEKQEALAASSFLAGRPIYQIVRRSLDDLVRAVLILLGLAIPFAFALERLLIGATNIYRQILWFCVFFVSTFLILFLVHPAFAVSNQPVIIFLAFALMMLSSLVIVIIMQKFEMELKVLQGMTSTVHTADVSRFNTMMAAMGMGISTMRRRPLRTALTALTITLLTFTILNFASFDMKSGVVTLFEGSTPKYTGVLIHKVNFATLDPEVVSVIGGRWGGETQVTSRYWLPAGTDAKTDQGPLITRADGARPNSLRGVLGLDAAEVRNRPDLRKLLGDADDLPADAIYMTDALARDKGLDIRVGDDVLLGGIRLRVAGLLDSAAVVAAKDMDDNGILPVDFSVMSSSQSTSSQNQQKDVTGADVLADAQNKQEWVPLPTDSVVIVNNDTARRLGATLRVISLYTNKDAQQATAIAEDAARMLPLPVVATRLDGVYTHVLAPTVKAKGIKDLIFPVLLGALVIFGTMLGSVADREKEIYTFSALGLAPTHVATLFFAEAMVYSFIGGMGGYLLAQGLMKVLSILAQHGYMTMPEMNYSSFNAIITILIVMATVLVSAIYPAIKASRSANPGILRSWQPPAPDGDHMHITFPFTVSSYDLTGVISFLKEHFDNFAETGLGVFMARNTRIIREGDSLGLRSLVALAPFDLGVTQEFELRSVPSEIAGIDEVKIEIERASGQQKDWERLNKVLLDDMRRQFLIWRSLPQETMEMYRERTLVALGEGVEPAAAPAPAAPQTV